MRRICATSSIRHEDRLLLIAYKSYEWVMSKKRTRRVACAVAGVTTAALLTALPTPATADAEATGATSRVIVRLSGAPAAAGARLDQVDAAGEDRIQSRRRATAAAQDSFLDGAREAGISAKSMRRFTLLDNAMALTVPQNQIAALRRMPGVVSVSPDGPVRASTAVSVPLVGAPKVWKKKAPDGTPARGTGVTVAILDSGIDYDHPDLGGGFGPGHKVVAGHDFVNGDDDPMDDNGHGTHVAGIVAGKAATADGVTGVAPEATLTAYKVMDDAGSGYMSDIIAGLEAATDPANPHRADVVNMSLGGAGDGTDPLGLAATAAVRAGVVVVAAAGNTGPSPSTVSSPAAAPGVIAVGASTSGVRVPAAYYVNGGKRELVPATPFVMSANGPAEPVTASLVHIGSTAVGVDWDKVGDVRGKALVVEHLFPRRPDTGESLHLLQEAERRGAVAVFGGTPGMTPSSVDSAERGVLPAQPSAPRVTESGDDTRFDSIVAMSLDPYAYSEMTALAAKGGKVEVRGTDATDQIASFSSRGPVAGHFALKPEIVAPGVQIRSTIPNNLWAPGVFRLSGTSMAAPHVAGAAALVRQLRPGSSPQDVTSALVNSAKPLDGTGVATQGAGRLDLDAATESTLNVSPAVVSFGAADLSQDVVRDTATVTVSNPGQTSVKATVKVSGAATVTPSRVALRAGETARITLRVRAQRPSLDTDTDIEGRISLRPDRGSTLTVPYLLAVRPLIVRTSPDPSDGRSTAYVYSPSPLSSPPVVRVTPPKGRSTTVTAVHYSGDWYTAALIGSVPGTHRVDVTARTSGGKVLVGADAFEVTSQTTPSAGWQPVGPNADAGELTPAPSAPSEAVMSQYFKAALWHTSDNGSTWKQLNRPPVAEGNGHVVVDPGDAAHWWYAVSDPNLGTSLILETRDRGQKWEIRHTTNNWFRAFVADKETRTLVAVSDTELLVSRDRGQSWTAVPLAVSSPILHAMIEDDTLYLTTTDSLLRVSGITGDTPGEAERLFTGHLYGPSAAIGDALAVYDTLTGVHVSQDGGQTWSLTLQLPYDGYGVKASGGDLFAGAGRAGKIWVSHDRGRTWQAVPARSSIPVDFEQAKDGSLTVSVPLDGLYRSAADGTGARRIGVQGLTVNDLAISGGTLMAGTRNGVYRTALPVRSPEWGDSGGEASFGVGVMQLSAVGSTTWRTRSVLGTFLIERSDDAGETWTQIGSHGGDPSAITVDSANPDHIAVSYSIGGEEAGVFTTADGGKTWRTRLHDSLFTALANDPHRPDRLWLGAEDGLYRSDDFGATVTKVASGMADSIVLDGPRLIVGGAGIRVSTDGGRTFTSSDIGGLPTTVSDIVRAGDALYAATTADRQNGLRKGGRGVLRSTDDGRTWTNVSGGLQNLDATRLVASPDGKALYVGTIDGGVHRLSLRR